MTLKRRSIYIQQFLADLKVIAQFRVSSCQLEIETGRHHNTALEDRLCQFCFARGVVVIEDEYHVLLNCIEYEDLRYNFLRNIPKNLFTFTEILCNKDCKHLYDLAVFLLALFEKRTLLLSINI